ncbi:MAG: alanine--tRNA ligase [Armatimonadota bacterium]|nr:alanine--tRNA ligase [Armatimonadota bacterium]
MLSAELRTKYLKFFEGKGHLIQPSDSLAPDDPTLLFTSAGMVQFKPYFVGVRVPPSRRIATCQKCLRTDDIDEVGDAVHHTFFEMLGNFSFGDYFKREAITWAWEFLTEVLKLDPENLWTSVYLDDDEAADVWIKEVGFPADRVVRLGEDKNYWPANAPSKGPNGPCGPCNEIFLDVTPELGRPADPAWAIARDGNRFVEIWNLVFTQFDRQADGTMKPLPSKNIDTGMGLERTAAVLQGTKTDYETDLFLPVIRRVEEISGAKYGNSADIDVPMRVIADHVRGAVFAASDGIAPSNAGRGYVVRRMIRKAILRSRNLGVEGNFLDEIIPVVVDLMKEPYPELAERQSYITNILKSEEERFRRTLDAGISRLESLTESAVSSGSKEISGEAAFTLYDTYGFPIELTQELAKEQGLDVETAGFEGAMEEQRRRAREGTAIPTELFAGGGGPLSELQRKVGITQFIGYEQMSATSRIAAILKGGKLVDRAVQAENVEVVLDQTPFYAESGGQVGDTGRISHGDTVLRVTNTLKVAEIFFHHCDVESGEIAVGMRVGAEVDRKRRLAIGRNHTATHLLHAALRKVLGEHALQSGSVVQPSRLRFDFSHNKAVTDEEIRRIEEMVNEKILEEIPVTVTETTVDEARKLGAIALFGEKYGETVRVIRIGDYSAELCGGTHLHNTSEVGLFKLISESSIGAGLRRVEAVTGQGVLDHMRDIEDRVAQVAHNLGVSPVEVIPASARIASALKEMQKQAEQLQAKGAARRAEELAESAKSIGGVNLVTGKLTGANIDALSMMADSVVDRLKSVVVVLSGVSDGKVMFVSKVTPDLVAKGFHAGNLVREVAKVAGGGGGGRPEFAQAGAKDPNLIDEALAKAVDLVRTQAGA